MSRQIQPETASPFRRPFEWALGRPLDLAALRGAATLLHGTHDFQAFAAKGPPKPHYHCRLGLARWELRPAGAGVSFEVEADRFLHHMVRMLVGTMVDVGLGRRPLSDIDMLLGSGDNQRTSPPAPAEGLYFIRASYPAELYLTEASPLAQPKRSVPTRGVPAVCCTTISSNPTPATSVPVATTVG